MRLPVESLLDATARRLAALQHQTDGPEHYAGELPMRLTGEVCREDHNFLTGYALLHVAVARHRGALPAAAAERVGAILAAGREVPLRYRSPGGTSNWYHGKASGCAAPAGYPWPGGRVLCLADDYDDTAVSALLTSLGPCEAGAPYRPELFLRAARAPRNEPLTAKSQRRLALAGDPAGVYRTWVLAEDAEARPLPAGALRLPRENSVELTTVANVATAVHRLGAPPDLPEQRAALAFVDRLARVATAKLLDGDASYLDFASSYYPRVPFAPLAFVVRDHWLTGGALLSPETAALVARAVLEVDEDAGWRMGGFLARAFWLSCAAWSVVAGLVRREAAAPRLARVAARVCAEAGADGSWPDVVFFHAAHLGDYGGPAYTQALMLETLALLHELGVGEPCRS